VKICGWAGFHATVKIEGTDFDGEWGFGPSDLDPAWLVGYWTEGRSDCGVRHYDLQLNQHINDEVGRVLSTILPDTREIGFSYDASGNLTSITPPGKPTHEFSYTPVNLLDTYYPPMSHPG
jgi:YD repeat-containing protein